MKIEELFIKNNKESFDSLPQSFQDRILCLVNKDWTESNNGNHPKWQNLINDLPPIKTSGINFGEPSINIGNESEINEDQRAGIHNAMRELIPWRKGPFNFFGIPIDSEWRSDFKYSRITSLLDIKGKSVLDIGCGNGYFMRRMESHHPEVVVGCESHHAYVMQYLIQEYFLIQSRSIMIPSRFESLRGLEYKFDTILSMGVLYHQKKPADHLSLIKSLIADNGALILETLIVPDQYDDIVPDTTYAGMRNTYRIPRLTSLIDLLRRSGFNGVDIVDKSVTTEDEQRRTPWMPFKTLEDYIDKNDESLTIEGYPRPLRIVLKVKKN